MIQWFGACMLKMEMVALDPFQLVAEWPIPRRFSESSHFHRLSRASNLTCAGHFNYPQGMQVCRLFLFPTISGARPALVHTRYHVLIVSPTGFAAYVRDKENRYSQFPSMTRLVPPGTYHSLSLIALLDILSPHPPP